MTTRPTPAHLAWLTMPAFVMVATGVAFVAVAFTLTFQLRTDLRAQILQREAESLRSMVALQEERAKDEFARYGLGAEAADWFPLLLETSRLRGVVALRLFDEAGVLRDALPMPGSAQIATDDWRRLELGESFARLQRDVVPESVRMGRIETNPRGGAPLLEVLVPLRAPVQSAFGGAAQYWINGEAMQREFDSLDRHLWLRSGLAVSVGTALVLAALAWAFRQLQARNAELARANQEFSVVAKTSAVGAITAHLLHGLKNPIAGLEGYVASQIPGDNTERRDERRKAVETTQWIRTLVNEVVNILHEEESGAKYRVSTGELVTAVEGRIRPVAEARGIAFRAHRGPGGELPGRRAHLVILVLDNLLRNACEATPAGRHVTLWADCHADLGRLEFVVEDEGPGFSTTARDRLFQPVTSSKPDGGGIGLVLSHQLAQHAGGTLGLEKSDARGSRFRLSVPLSAEAVAP